MKILGLIPARYASTRFPGKPLVMIDGKTMIRRVYEQASKASRITTVAVATDDQRIADEVRSFGGQVVMTGDMHRSGTDRCAEAVQKVPGNWDVVINIQGDEPYVQPEQIDLVAALFENEAVQIGTLVKQAKTDDELFSPNTIKVILNKRGEGVYFSRAPIPFMRGVEQSEWLKHHTYYKHIGIYAYRSAVLQQLTELPEGSLEKTESLEQLRWIENGYTIHTAFTTLEAVSVDVPEDLDKLKIFF